MPEYICGGKILQSDGREIVVPDVLVSLAADLAAYHALREAKRVEEDPELETLRKHLGEYEDSLCARDVMRGVADFDELCRRAGTAKHKREIATLTLPYFSVECPEYGYSPEDSIVLVGDEHPVSWDVARVLAWSTKRREFRVAGRDG